MFETLAGIKEIFAGSGQILSALTNLIKISEETRSNTKLMDSQTKKIENSMNQIMNLSRESSSSISETAIGITEITKAVNEVANLSTKNFENNQILEKEISKFKT
jgi:methyl-accepting chemotaxis protein